MFADDTTLFHSSRILTQLINIINTELTNVVNWLNANRLSLNVDKTNFMVFRPKVKNQECPNIQINGSEIKEVSSAKFLGVIIDNKMSWAEHINHISRKVLKSIDVIIKARKSFDNDTLLNLYSALILPHISYCIQVWGTAASVHIKRLHVLQMKIVRIICGVHPRTHTQPLVRLLHLLSINQIRDYYFVAIFMYKMKNNLMPEHFGQMFTNASEINNYPTKFACQELLKFDVWDEWPFYLFFPVNIYIFSSLKTGHIRFSSAPFAIVAIYPVCEYVYRYMCGDGYLHVSAYILLCIYLFSHIHLCTLAMIFFCFI